MLPTISDSANDRLARYIRENQITAAVYQTWNLLHLPDGSIRITDRRGRIVVTLLQAARPAALRSPEDE